MTKEEWTRGPGTPPTLKGLIWYTDGSRTWGKTWAGVYGQSSRRRHSISLGKCTTVFQAKICAILACAHEIKKNARPGKQVNICSESQVPLKALQAAGTSQLVQQCQKPLNDIFTLHSVGLFWIPVCSGLRGNEIANELTRE